MYEAKLYYHTGFNAVNIPDSLSTLEAAADSIRTFPTLDLLQPTNLSVVRVKILYQDALGADYVCIKNNSNSHDFCFYSIEGDPVMTSADIAEFLVVEDPILTAGGVENLNVTGMVSRHHVDHTNERFGEYDEDDPYLVPSQPVLEVVSDVYFDLAKPLVEDVLDVDTGIEGQITHSGHKDWLITNRVDMENVVQEYGSWEEGLVQDAGNGYIVDGTDYVMADVEGTVQPGGSMDVSTTAEVSINKTYGFKPPITDGGSEFEFTFPSKLVGPDLLPYAKLNPDFKTYKGQGARDPGKVEFIDARNYWKMDEGRDGDTSPIDVLRATNCDGNIHGAIQVPAGACIRKIKESDPVDHPVYIGTSGTSVVRDNGLQFLKAEYSEQYGWRLFASDNEPGSSKYYIANPRVFYGKWHSYKLLALGTGSAIEYLPEELTGERIDTLMQDYFGLITPLQSGCKDMPQIGYFADPREGGKPYFNVWKKDHTKKTFAVSAIQGENWKDIPVMSSVASGQALYNLQYALNQSYKDYQTSDRVMDLKGGGLWGVIGGGISKMLGTGGTYAQSVGQVGINESLMSATGASDIAAKTSAGMQSAGLAAVGNLASGALSVGGSALGNSMTKDLHNFISDLGYDNWDSPWAGGLANWMKSSSNSANDLAAKLGSTRSIARELRAIEKTNELTTFAVQSPAYISNISSSYSVNKADFFSNGCILLKRKLSNVDFVKFDKVLNMFGYQHTDIMKNEYFNNKPKFNYVQASLTDVEILNPNINHNKSLEDKIKDVFGTGIRIWHVKPNIADLNNPFNNL